MDTHVPYTKEINKLFNQFQHCLSRNIHITTAISMDTLFWPLNRLHLNMNIARSADFQCPLKLKSCEILRKREHI